MTTFFQALNFDDNIDLYAPVEADTTITICKMGSGGVIVWEGDVRDQRDDGSGGDDFWVGNISDAADAVYRMGEKFLSAIENPATRSAWESAILVLES